MDGSENSSSSSLTSLSDDFSYQVKRSMDNKTISTNHYMKIAEEHLEKMARHPCTKQLTLFGSRDIDPHSILAAMLKYAPKGGQRYVACAIITCAEEVATLVDLADTWLCYLLLPILGSSSRRKSRNPTEEATPPLEETQQAPNSISKARARDFRAQIMHRDGFQCAITGWYDLHCRPELRPRGDLEAAHIVRRSVAVFSEKETAEAAVTWEIIRQYTNWSVERMAEMIDSTDTPSNGFLLQKDFHSSWDRLDWTLAPKEVNGLVVPNTYVVQVLKDSDFPAQLHPRDTITFRDNSVTDGDHMDEQHRKRYPKPHSSVSLPNPEFIEFHHAMANVLHMSGAARAIDLPMDQLDRRRSPVKVMDTPELMLRLSGLQLMDRMYSELDAR